MSRWSPSHTTNSLPIGLEIGAGAARDYLVLDFIHGTTERECIRDGVDPQMYPDLDEPASCALYPTHRRSISLARLLRSSEAGQTTLFAIKSARLQEVVAQHPTRGRTVGPDYTRIPHGTRYLDLIWHGTRMHRQRSTTFHQDFLHPHRGKQHIVELFDAFINVPIPTIEVPRHCAVLELLGPSLSEIRTERASQRLETGVVKEATRQVLLALDFLHTQCGILYLGLDTASVLVKFATEQEAFDFYLQKDLDALDLTSIHVKLTGFDCAELIDNGPLPSSGWGPMNDSDVQRHSTAPEIDPFPCFPTFRYLCQLDPDGISADVWSLGSFIWELLTGEEDVVHADSDPAPEDPEELDEEIWAVYGIQRYLNFLKFTTERSYPPKPAGYMLDRPDWDTLPDEQRVLYDFPDALRTDQGWSMRERLVAHDVLPDGDVDQVVTVLRGCFQADPSRRLTVRQLMELEWLREGTRP